MAVARFISAEELRPQPVMVDRSIRLLWCIFLCLIAAALITETSAIDCGNDYTVKEPGKDDYCESCGTCHPGYGREPPCGTVQKFPLITNCKPCKKGTFSDADDSKPCKACHRCTKPVFKECTNTSNTECGNCTQGYYHEKASFDCRKCSHCCGDGKDTVIEECTNRGMPKHISCTIHRAHECNPPDERVTGLSTLHAASGNEKDTPTYVWIIAALGGLVGLLCAAGLIYCICRNRPRSNRRGRVQDPNLTRLESADGVNLPDVVTGSTEFTHGLQDVNYNAPAKEEKPQATLKVKGFKNLVYAPSPNVTPKRTPTHSDDELEEEIAVEKKETVSELKKIPDVSKTLASRKNSISSTGSQEGKGERRPRASSFQELQRQVSRKLSSASTYSQMENEEVVITKHPRSKVEITEGERLELCCEATGPSDMCYQWQKNSEDIPYQTKPTLVVTSAKVKDFGRYVCRVGKMKTNPAEVDVKPRPGTRHKLFSKVDEDTKEKICRKLNNKSKSQAGLGGWKQLARKYSLDKDHIDEMGASQNPAESVLEFLGGCHCHLTVYEFIKTLTDPEVKRNDVVSLLLLHLTEEDSDSDML